LVLANAAPLASGTRPLTRRPAVETHWRRLWSEKSRWIGLPPARVAVAIGIAGFTLHAATRCREDDRHRLARLCRYVTRPAFADDQLRRDGGSRVSFEPKTPWRDGTTHLEMTPVDFLERLAALVPRPRLRLIRFHGILAPNAKLRNNDPA
jgi:hypothetical protein